MLRILLLLSCFAMPAAATAQARLTGDLPRREAKPLEAVDGLETEYGSVRTSDGVRLRTIVTRPAGTSARLPALFIAQWVSCETIEFPAGRKSQLSELAKRAGMVMLRVERSGTGDSEGPGCDKLDYDTEVRHYRDALDQLARHQWVDSERVVIYGSSLGSTTAPLIAQGRKLAGIMVQGGGAETYLERMINFDRHYLERSIGYTPDRIHVEMHKRIPFQVEYLVHGRMPAEIEATRPELKGVWASIRGTGPDSHYGRPFAWHQQAAKRDFLTAWTKIEAPVLVIYGEYDQFERREGHALIVDTVNALRPGSATLVEIPGVDHGLARYPNAIAAYRGEGGKADYELFLKPALDWLKAVVAR